MPTWETTTDWDSPQSETGVHHEQPTGTDWAASDVVEKGYPSSDEGGSSLDIYWPLDEDSGTTANDVANGNDGTVNGATVGQNGILATSGYRFDGTDDFVGYDPVPTQGASAFTVALWAKSDSTGIDAALCGPVEDDNSWGDDGATGIRYDASGFSGGESSVLKVGVRNTNGDAVNGESSANSQTTDWQHIALTWSSGNAPILYLNGSAESWSSSPGTLSGSVDFNDPDNATVTADSFGIGTGLKTSSGRWDGLISDVRLYSRELSSSEITDFYQSAL